MAGKRQTGVRLASDIGVKEVLTDELQPNPHNPRKLFDREPLEILKASIEKVGILVPLTVYKGSKEKKFTILDGQRRWMCAQVIGLKAVPVNQIREPTLTENIVTMFQIHKLREDWELMPTALKLDVLRDELHERRDKQLSELTGLNIAVVVRCKKLLRFPAKYQELMLFPEPDHRVKADFFIELHPIVFDRSIVKADWYERDTVIDQMLDKYKNKKSGIKAVTDFRKIKQSITAARKAKKEGQLLKRFHEFLENDNLTISHLEIAEATIHRQATKIIKSLKKLHDELSGIRPDEHYGEEELWVELERLMDVIRRKLRDAGRRPK